MAKAPHPVLKRLGNRVRELRKAKGYSQEEFADICKIDRSYMSGIERGVRNISVLNLQKLARALSIHIADLFL